MAHTKINVTLQGSAVTDGSIELRRLVQFSERLQKTVDQIAYATEKQGGVRQARRDKNPATALRLVNTSKGSFAAELDFVRPQIFFEGYHDAGTEAITKLVSGLEALRQSDEGGLPDGFDQGVLVVLQELGKMFSQGIETMQLTVSTAKQTYSSTFDSYTLHKIDENISEPEEKIAAVTGQLLMANFSRKKYRCHLYLNDSDRLSCTFDEDAIDQIDQAMRHDVYAIGIATLNPINDEIAEFHIKQVIILDGDPVSSQYLEDKLDAYIRDNDTVAKFKQSWQQALAGETYPLEDLWEGIDAE